MKNKLFKIGKPMLSIAVAVAILAVSLFAAVPGISFSANAATVEDTWDGTQDPNLEGLGTDTDPYIISTAEQLAYVALSTTFGETKGKYYKVVDNAVFNLNGMEGITLESGIGDVMSATATGKVWMPSESRHNNSFAGHFDGNDVVIYNMYSVGNWNVGNGDTGLFPNVTFYPDQNGVLSFTNITLLNSRSNGSGFSGGIIGQSYVKDGTIKLSFENCKVSNCWITDAGLYTAGKQTSGILAGTVNHANTTIKNCIAVDNVTSATNITGGLIGNTSQWNGGLSVANTIVIGSSAYPVLSEGSAEVLYEKTLASGSYSGVYTTEAVDTATYSDAQVKQVALDDMKGAAAMAAMPNLDWTKWIAFDGELPDYRDNHTLVIGDGDASGHKIECSDADCGKTMIESHAFVENEYGTMNVCACGYSVAVTDRSEDTWDGSYDNNFAGSGTKDDPYIITTAEQMAYVALKTTPAESGGKYYKVAPYKVFNMNGKNGITLTSTAAEVKAASDNKVWTSGDTKTFSGNFDGNGVIIYNIRSGQARSYGYSGLFPFVTTENDEKSVSIKNVTIVASYFVGYHFSGGIVGRATAPEGGYSLTIENCAVKNSYMTDESNSNTNASRTAAIFVGTVEHNSTVINNCFALNNITDGSDRSGGFIGDVSTSASDDPKITNSIIIGSSPIVVVGHNPSGNRPVTARAIAAGNFKNVYTDQYVKSEYENKINKLELSMMTGVSAPQNMNELDYNSYWFANTGLIDLQICHQIVGTVYVSDNYAGHNIACKVCELNGVIISNHKYNDSYTCTVCDFKCDHKNDEYISKVEYTLDCITSNATGVACACGFEDLKIHEPAKGHDLVKTEGVAPNCIAAGNKEYYTCKVCENIFLTDDKFAPMEEAVTKNSIILSATGVHTPKTDDSGEILYYMDEVRHCMQCEVCDAKYGKVKHTAKYTPDKNSATHTVVCDICLYEVTESASHNFDDDSEKCIDCEWICDHKDTVVAVAVSETSCAAEGAKVEHYKCTVCDVRFSDAAATQKIEKASVAIEKLEHTYTNIDENGTVVQDYNDTHHWYNCSECGICDYAEHTIVEDSESYEGVYRWCEDEKGYGCNYSTFDYSIVNEDETVNITAPTNAFTKDVITDIFEVSKKDDIYETLAGVLNSNGYETFTAYEISPSQDLDLENEADITIEIPVIYGNLGAIVLVDSESENKTIKKLETEVITVYLDKSGNELDVEALKAELTPEKFAETMSSAKEKYLATASSSEFGYFAVVEAEYAVGDATGNGSNNQGSGSGDNSLTSPPTGENVIFTAVLTVILASATVLFVRKAKI